MLLRLAFNNIRKNIADYWVYFFTLTLGVALFYTFNSISSQQFIATLSNTQKEQLFYLENLLMISSIFISIIFFMLCIFANQFILKRRKKEFALYITLGMSKFKVAMILVLETLMIGLVAVFIGLILGLAISQLTSYLNAMLFNTVIIKHQFIVSTSAIIKTLILFSLVFVMIMFYNIIKIFKTPLNKLLKPPVKAIKTSKVSNTLQVIISIIAIIMLVVSYIIIIKTDFYASQMTLIIGVVMMLIATLLLYMFSIKLVLNNIIKVTSIYFKNINIFTINQLNRKLKIIIPSIIAVSYMLFATFTILTNGLSYKESIEKEINLVAPYDASIVIQNYDNQHNLDINALIEKIDLDLENQDYVDIDVYSPGISLDALLRQYAVGSLKNEIENGYPIYAQAISQSDFNKLLAFQKLPTYDFTDNQTMIITNANNALETIKNLVNNVQTFEIGNQTLTLNDTKYIQFAIETENVGRTIACFVVPDDIVENLKPLKTIIDVQFKNKLDTTQEKFDKRFEYMLHNNVSKDPSLYISGQTKAFVSQLSLGLTINVLYVCIYIAIVFLISSGSVIALRLLTDASDEKADYNLLSRLGASNKTINRSILLQTSIYFVLPLILAIPNTIVISVAMIKILEASTTSYSLLPALITCVVLLFIYGGYYLLTYFGYKKIIYKK